MTPEERVAYLEHLDKVIRTRNTWDDLRALDAYLSLWEMAYAPARLAVQVSAAARTVVEQEEPAEPTDQLDRDLDVLARVGRMYLDALDSDPENEMLTPPEAMLVTEVRAAVERREASWEPAEQPEPAVTWLDPRAPIDHALLDRLEVVSHNGVDDREGWSEVVMREVPEQRCPACSRPATSIRDQGADGLTVARQWLPCGCTRIVPVGGDRG